MADDKDNKEPSNTKYPEYDAWAIAGQPGAQAPSNFGKRLDPDLRGNVENRENDPKDPLSLAAMYAAGTPDRIKEIAGRYLPSNTPPIPPAPAGSLADQAGLNAIGQAPKWTPQTTDSAQRLAGLLRGPPATPPARMWSLQLQQHQAQQQTEATQRQVDQLRKDLGL